MRTIIDFVDEFPERKMPKNRLFSLWSGRRDSNPNDRSRGILSPKIAVSLNFPYKGRILDGRNRYRAAQAAGVDCPFITYDGDEPASCVISLNLHRRHLTESQRAMVPARLAILGRGDDQHTSIEGSSTQRAADLLNV